MVRYACALLLLFIVTLEAKAEFDWGFLPAPVIPADNAISDAKVALGKRLFFDTRLSITQSYSCASCHNQQRYFTDGLPQAIGATGEVLLHNTPSLYNVAFNASFGWKDTGARTLERQLHIPLFNKTPIELGFNTEGLTTLQADQELAGQFKRAFNQPTITNEQIIQALSSYLRTLNSPPSAFDQYVFNDDESGFSDQAQAGLALFFSEKLGCSNCHASLNLSGPIRHSLQPQTEPVFHVMGVNNSSEAYRAPSLRGVSLTAPYMHDGSMTGLTEVLDHYQNHPSERVPDFVLNQTERDALLHFLNTL